ncbi:hypothetical protein HOP50_02g12390 [Chloropicon primus]|nr:hypothetical protein HOP50_02g12390 [Chloropicon primus]
MGGGLALVPELAAATRYAAICVGSAQVASVVLKKGKDSGQVLVVGCDSSSSSSSSYNTGGLDLAGEGGVGRNKTYVPEPKPFMEVFNPRTALLVLGRNLTSRLALWMNELQENLNEAVEREEESEEEEGLDVDVPPFRPVVSKALVGVAMDYAVLILKRTFEILASTLVEPKLACKLLKDFHDSAKRKRLKYFFDSDLSLKVRVVTGATRVRKCARTAARGAFLGFLAELTINEVVVIYRTAKLAKDEDNTYSESLCEKEGRYYTDSLDYFQRHTLSNFVRVSSRFVFASVGVGVGSLISINEPKVLPAAFGKLGTVLGFAAGNFLGGKLVDVFLLEETTTGF